MASKARKQTERRPVASAAKPAGMYATTQRGSVVYREVTMLRPDPRGRVTLAGIKKTRPEQGSPILYKQYISDEGEILLIPVVAVPARELWVYQNPEVHAALVRGIEEAGQGKVKDRGSFAEYTGED